LKRFNQTIWNFRKSSRTEINNSPFRNYANWTSPEKIFFVEFSRQFLVRTRSAPTGSDLACTILLFGECGDAA